MGQANRVVSKKKKENLLDIMRVQEMTRKNEESKNIKKGGKGRQNKKQGGKGKYGKGGNKKGNNKRGRR
jgi:hypothetical protein